MNALEKAIRIAMTTTETVGDERLLCEEKTYFGCVARTWRCVDHHSRFPFMFSVTKHGGAERLYEGLANRCASRFGAWQRARWRAKRIDNGTYEQHYGEVVK